MDAEEVDFVTRSASILPREWCRGPQYLAGAEEEWAPVVRRAQAAWGELELVSVTEGLRDSALARLTPAEVPVASADCAANGLQLTVLRLEGETFRAAAHRPGLGAAWHVAWTRSDHEMIGQLLGFPECCRAFFRREWVERGSCDVTRAMGAWDGPWEANTMLRWLGLRLVPHLPCSAACSATVDQARAYLAAGRRLGVEGLDDLERVLRLPATYEARGLVLTVETPHFRLMAGADPDTAPATIARASQSEPATWEDNGFTSLGSMAAAHAVVEFVVRSAPFSRVLDLGCGDGALLASLDPEGWGVEVERGRVDRGRRRHPGLLFVQGRIQDAAPVLNSHFDVALLMPGRLLEMTEEEARETRNALRALADRLVVYAYGDQLRKWPAGGLDGMSEAAGVEVVGGHVVSTDGTVAAAEGRIM